MISVIIPLYNKEKYIYETIHSVICQTFTKFELLIINDGSTDSSLNILESIIDDRIKIFNKKNNGVSSARNYGIKKSIYHYVTFLDADDIIEPEYLSNIVNLIHNYPNHFCFSTNYKFQKNNTIIFPRFRKINHISEVYILDDFIKYSSRYPVITSSSITLNKEVFNKVGLFNINISQGEDIDMWLRISKYYNIVFLNKCLVLYKVNSEGNTYSMPITIKNNFISYFHPKDHINYIYFSQYSVNVAIKYLLNNTYNNEEFNFILSKINKYSLGYFLVIFLNLFPRTFLKYMFK
jgi:glycosyltransferase involved in cell wall biosynthesis